MALTISLILVGWFLGAIPLLFVLRATRDSHNKRVFALSAAHAEQLDAVRRQMERAAEAAVEEAVAAERETARELARMKREREPKMVVVRPY